jgi:sialate O-acetylesterase
MIARNFISSLVLFVIWTGGIEGQNFKFASSYTDHMVLQRAPLRSRLWGYADDDALITMALNGKEYKTIAVQVDWSTSSVWSISLDPVEADNKPTTIEVVQQAADGMATRIQISDVLFGDVFMCVIARTTCQLCPVKSFLIPGVLVRATCAWN